MENEPKPCLEWTKARSSAGYGQKWSGGKTKYLHRLTWEEYNGPIPAGMKVLHKCDNPPCYEITHLFLGTSKDNAIDMAKKGRQTFQKNPEKHPRGRKHHNAKFTEDEIRKIRASPDSMRALARKYNVSFATMQSIVKRKTWIHVR